MSADQIERLQAGIRAAHQAGNAYHVRRLGTELRRLQAQMGQQGEQPEQEVSSNPFRDLQTAFRANVDPILEGMGTTAEVLGRDGLADTLRGATEAPENYVSPTDRFMSADEDDSFAWRYLPGAIGEQIGQFAGSVAARGLGALGGGGAGLALGPKGAAAGAVAGAFAGPAMFEAMQALGPIAIERARNNGREEPNREDLLWAAGTSAGQGALNAIAPGLSGVVKRMLAEGATEGAQGVIQQTGETLATDTGLEVDFREALGEGIIGAGSAGVVDASVATVGATTRAAGNVANNAIQNIRTDSREFSDAEVAAAERLVRAADGDMSVLGNVDDVGQGTAKGAANAAVREIRAESGVIVQNLRRLAREQGEPDALAAVESVVKTMSAQNTPTPDSFLDALDFYFPNEPDVQRLRRLHGEMNAIQDFTAQGTRDMGGLTSLTRLMDVTDARNSLKLAGYASMANLSSAATTIAGGAVVNRTSRLVDRLTNRRSRVKRFVDSARRSGRKADPIEGRTAADSLEELKKIRKAEKATQRLMTELAQAKAQGRGSPLDPSNGAVRQAQGENLAQQFQMESFATEDLFTEGAVVPADDPNPVVQGHYMWQQATGLSPTDTLDVLEQLAREGRVPQDTPQRFRENIRSFSKDPNTPLIQRMVAQRAQSDPERNFRPKKTPPTPEAVVRKLQAVDSGLTTDRRKQKAREGDRRYRNLIAEIDDSADGLKADQLEMLYDLAESINSPNMTRVDRFRLVEDMLNAIFPRGKAMRELWRKRFAPLAAIGNDYAIEREAQDPVEAEKEQEFEQKVEKAAKSQRKKRGQTPAEETQLELDLQPAETRADSALKKLREGRKAQAEAKTAGQEVQDAKEPQPEKQQQPSEKRGSRRKLKIKDRVEDRIQQINYAVLLAGNEAEALQQHRDSLPRSTEGRVEDIFYDLANDRMTQNMVTEAFASRFGVPVVEAARVVNDALVSMEQAGKIKRVKPKSSDRLRYDGKIVRDAEGKPLDVVQIEVLDQGLSDNIEIAKAVRQVENMVPQDGEVEDFSPNRNQIGAHRALKDPPSSGIDGSFAPIFNFLNSLRSLPLSINNAMMTQIEEALDAATDRRVGTIGEQLLPPTKVKGRRDEGPLRTMAQMLFQLGPKDERGSTRLYQEWTAGANLRVYSKNGLAHAQAGDIMKGLLRMPDKAPVGGERGLNFVFHNIGNLLGFDKKSPAERRNALFVNDMVDPLIKFAENPFGRTTLTNSRGNLTQIGKIVKDGEGFFQVLNAAHEVRNMVNWARERFPGKSKMSNSDLLQDPEVRADMAQNYETDMIVQLDASNNAYQIAGMVMGYEDVLRATGMLPPVGQEGDPDTIQGADIYLEPALAIAERVPEIQALDLPASKLRKLFKKPIGTYLYAAEFSSRREAFQEVLEDIAAPADPIGFSEADLITIPQTLVDGMKSDEGFTFIRTTFDINGDVKQEKPVRRKVVEKDGKFFIATAEGAGKFKDGLRRYETAEDAIRETYATDLYARMNRELVRDMNTRYPGMRQYLGFAQTVSEIVKGRGQERVKVPTKDGMMLEYSFKQNPEFVGVPVDLGNGRTVSMGVRTDEYKLAGRGLAAFMTHQNDAWALRETYRRLQEGEALKGFNPIHDSYGFHPSDAARGQETWVQVMQELGSDDYNLFLQTLEANGISLEEYVVAGGDKSFILGRRGVAPVPARNIPTALS